VPFMRLNWMWSIYLAGFCVPALGNIEGWHSLSEASMI
jgi:hypothetical protein